MYPDAISDYSARSRLMDPSDWLPSSARRESAHPLPYKRLAVFDGESDFIDWPAVASPRCWDAPDAIAEATRIASARRNQERYPSPAEVEMLAALWYLGFEPKLQVPFGPYDVDFLIGEALVIEVDGHRYHLDKDRELRRDEYLRERHGLDVVHIAARSVMTHPVGAAKTATWAL